MTNLLNFNKYKSYILELIALASPMIMGNLGHILLGAGDVFVAGRHSVNTLASISIANAIIACFVMFGIGIMSSISPLLSNYRGEGKEPKDYFLSTIIYSFIISALISLMMFASNFFIDKLGFSPDILPDIKDYIFISAFSTFGAFLHFSLKEFLQSFENVFFANFISLIAVFVNIFLNFILVFGMYGFPELGVKGLAIASLIVRYLIGFSLLIYCLKEIRLKKFIDIKFFKQLFKIGLPIAFASVIEFVAFNISTILMGRIQSIFAACQNIIVIFSSITFMIPLAISNAIAIKVGFANGEKNYMDLRNYSISGVSLDIIFMSFCAFLFITYPKFFIEIFSKDIQVIKICIPILMVVGIFQIFDGMQISFGGILKGLKQTKIVLYANLFAYWFIGLPLGLYLALKLNLYLIGFWISFATSLFILSIFLFFMIRRIVKKSKQIWLGKN